VVEGGVEARDLRQSGERLRERADRRQIVRLVQRCERHQALELGHHRRVDPHRRREASSTVHDAVPDGLRAARVGRRVQPAADRVDGAGVIVRCRRRLVDDDLAVTILDREAGAGTDACDLALCGGAQRTRAGIREESKLDARRARVDHQDQAIVCRGARVAGHADCVLLSRA